MINALVSIIVPIYNTAEYVEECILSILSQPYGNIELLLVNDGSTDGSSEICRKYSDLPNVTYVEQENSGTTAARKKGVDSAKGEWILFVDSDDYLLKDSISNMVALGILSTLFENINFSEIPNNIKSLFPNKPELVNLNIKAFMEGKQLGLECI